MNTASQDKGPLSRDQTPTRQMARRLVHGSGADGGVGHTAAHAAGGAWNQLYQNLSRWVGRDGCHALFARALAETRTDHPLLEEIQLRPRSEPYVEGVTETIDAYGAPQTAEAIESMLVRLIELLGRLIGDDLAVKLIEESFTESARDDARSSSKKAQA